MKESLELIITSLVSEPSQVSINEVDKGKEITYEVKVKETDMGKVIGREGRMAKAIRTIMKSIAAKEGKKVNIEFID